MDIRYFDEKAYRERFESSDYYQKRYLPKLDSILRDIYSDKIEDRVKGFNTIKITQKALDKGKYISKRICDLAGDYEIYMYLIGDKESSVIDDVYICQEQLVWPDYCRAYGRGKILSSFDIDHNMDKRVMGWAHSHGSLDTFHSNTDHTNLKKLALSHGLLEQIDLYDDECWEETMLHDVSYVSSLVFNKFLLDSGELPFAGISMTYLDLGKVRRYRINEGVNIEVVDSEDFVPDGSIDDQIRERVTFFDIGRLGDAGKSETDIE